MDGMNGPVMGAESAEGGVDHPRRWLILAVLALAVFTVSIDATVLNVALPTLGRDLHAGTGALQWTVDAYSLGLAGPLLLAGSLSDRFGRKRLLVAGLLVFGAASAAATFAERPWQLVAARAVMGLGASAFMPGTLSLLTQVFAERSRPRAIGIWGAVTALGAVGGPLIGGALLEHFWWGSLYLVNVVVVAVAVLGAVLLVPESTDPAARPVDPLSTLLSVLGVTGLVYGVIEQPRCGWESGRVLGGFAAGALALLAFALRQRRARHPMLDLGVLRDRRFLGSAGTMAVLMFALTGSLFVLTQQLQLVLGFSPLRAGAAMLPAAGALMVCSPLSSAVVRAAGTRRTVAAALTVFAAGFAVLATSAPGHGYPAVAAGLVLAGGGMGLAAAPVNDVLMSAGPPERSGLLSAMNDTVQEIGAAFGVAVTGSVLAARYAAGHPGGPLTAHPTAAARDAFGHAFGAATGVCAVVAALGVVPAAVLLPGRGVDGTPVHDRVQDWGEFVTEP
jgi:EmrB/QacA subfamily drug resistance transporter